ncbi:tetraspanin-18-like [Lolium rigidum]|uniref:tetraspanin-18-like n=1 Tax=Lolium rigidum TaxID=89674 RepID=UPI001F5DB699|nr:tetraspanin-18-like [Lolium rigidum]
MARGRSGRSGAGGGGCAGCFLGFLLKFLAFLQAFAAVSAVLYGAWIVSRWARHHELHLDHLLPDLWFACAVMAAGLLYCAILLAGYIAAEISSGCCLCFYTVLAMAMLLLEASVAGHLLLNEHWMQDLPYDRTGELNNLVTFVQNNLDTCKWTALATLATQALSLLLAMVLRAMVSTSRDDYDSDEDFVVIRRPLLVAQGAPSYLPTTADPRGVHPQLWSSSMRQKYGLNSSSGYTYNTLDHQNAAPLQ